MELLQTTVAVGILLATVGTIVFGILFLGAKLEKRFKIVPESSKTP